MVKILNFFKNLFSTKRTLSSPPKEIQVELNDFTPAPTLPADEVIKPKRTRKAKTS
jgi:hypothetical protein